MVMGCPRMEKEHRVGAVHALVNRDNETEPEMYRGQSSQLITTTQVYDPPSPFSLPSSGQSTLLRP